MCFRPVLVRVFYIINTIIHLAATNVHDGYLTGCSVAQSEQQRLRVTQN